MNKLIKEEKHNFSNDHSEQTATNEEYKPSTIEEYEQELKLKNSNEKFLFAYFKKNKIEFAVFFASICVSFAMVIVSMLSSEFIMACSWMIIGTSIMRCVSLKNTEVKITINKAIKHPEKSIDLVTELNVLTNLPETKRIENKIKVSKIVIIVFALLAVIACLLTKFLEVDSIFVLAAVVWFIILLSVSFIDSDI